MQDKSSIQHSQQRWQSATQYPIDQYDPQQYDDKDMLVEPDSAQEDHQERRG